MHISAMDVSKNVDLTLRVFLEFVEKHGIEDTVFVLDGSNGRRYLEANAETLGARKGLIISAGFVADEDLAALYSGADGFIYVSRYEGFGLPVLEAMQCGCPVVAGDNSSIPEVVGEAGLLINADSPDELMHAYERLYYEPEARAEMTRKGIERAKGFTWQKTVDLMVEQFEKMKLSL